MTRLLLALAVTASAVTACGTSSEPSPAGCAAVTSTSSAAKFVAEGNELSGTPVSVDETGEILVETGRNDTGNADGPATLRPGTLSVFDPATGRSEQVRGRQDIQPGTQTVFAALDHEHVVWMQETGTAPHTSDWSIYSASRRTGTIRLVAKARPIDRSGAKPAVPGYTIPRLHRGRVYWAEARPGRPPAVHIYARDLDSTAPPRLVVPDAIMPVPTGDWLYYASFHDRPGYAIHRRSLSTGRTELVASGSHTVTFLTAYDGTAGFVLSSGTVEVYAGPARRIAQVQAATGEQLGWLTASRTHLGFADGSGDARGGYVLDLRTACLRTLGPASTVLLGGATLIWNPATTWHYATLD